MVLSALTNDPLTAARTAVRSRLERAVKVVFWSPPSQLSTSKEPCYKAHMPDFRILGPLEASDETGQLLLGGQKQRAVLAMLLLEAGRVVSQDRLVDALWGETPPRTAVTSLQNFVSQLRKILGPEVLETRPPGYRVNVRRGELDLERFRLLVEDARRAEPPEKGKKLREALELWRGPPLADFSFESFAQPHIAHLEELRLATLEERVQADLDDGRHGELVGELEALVEAHPVRERLRGQYLLALYRSGRQAEALQAYQEGRRILVEQLGIEPSRELQQLHGAILRQEVGLQAPSAPVPSEDHFEHVLRALFEGRLVAVLGTDVAELATQLAERFDYLENGGSLPSIAQYVAVMKGSGPLYDELHTLLDADATPTPVHRFFAALPPLLRERGLPHQLLVTTSYDRALEAAFLEAGEEFDVVSYVASGAARGKFCHITPEGYGRLIDLPNTYATELSLETRTVILKLHGQVDRGPEREWESFVVTEDDYIDYLAQTDLAGAVPVALSAKLRRSHFLFLGYTMADWNLRVILNRLWSDQPLSYRSWAVQPQPKPLEREFWKRRDVDVHELPLEQYTSVLARYVGLELSESVV
jgi:DNA-binding SARP family transcriptional activator